MSVYRLYVCFAGQLPFYMFVFREENLGAATGPQSDERPTTGPVVPVRGGRQIME